MPLGRVGNKPTIIGSIGKFEYFLKIRYLLILTNIIKSNVGKNHFTSEKEISSVSSQVMCIKW